MILCLVLVLLCSVFDGEESTGCFTLVFLMVSWAGLIVAFPDHTHYLCLFKIKKG